MLSKLLNPKHIKTGLSIATISAAAMVHTAVAANDNSTKAMSPQAIEDAIDDELMFDHAVLSTNIDVSIVNGIVTMRGNVDNLLAKHRSAEIASTVKGVRSVVNLIEVKPTEGMTDKKLESHVSNALLSDPATDSYEVDVDAKSGAVTLTGTVDSYQERLLTETIVRGVRGVTEIDNQLAVDTDTSRTDSEIKHEIEAALRWNTLVDDGRIEVKVDDSHVKLEGTVGSSAEKTRARYIAYVHGVESVDIDGLNVKHWARDTQLRKKKYALKSADEIVDAVNDAMLYDPRVNSFDIDVSVAGSSVTLRGVVDNVKAKRAAATDARQTVGVTWVKNRIKVRPDSQFTNSELESKLSTSLKRKPGDHRYDIDVNVINGIAYLNGDVDSYIEKFEAGDVSERTKGISSVVSSLTVSSPMPLSYDPYTYEVYPYEYEWYSYSPSYTYKRDSQIAEDVRSQLSWSPFINSEDVTVTVDDGVAHLNGTVESWTEFNAATENAFEGGAVWVDNDVIVKNQ